MNVIKQSLPQKNRIVDLDVIRGFALIGIFLVNINMFLPKQVSPIKDYLVPSGLTFLLMPNFTRFSLCYLVQGYLYSSLEQKQKVNHIWYIYAAWLY